MKNKIETVETGVTPLPESCRLALQSSARRHVAGTLVVIASASFCVQPPAALSQGIVSTSDGQYARNGVSKELAGFLSAHAHSIAVSGREDFDDLAFLADVLAGKRIVMLGESNHGSREFNLQKNRLIRYLHGVLGYRLLLLESGMGEVYQINYERSELSPSEMLHGGLMGPWRTRENLELMQYLKDSPQLAVGGYDVQRSGRTFAKVLADLRVAVGEEEPDLFEGIEVRYTETAAALTDRKRELNDALTQEVAKLIADYGALAARISAAREKLMTSGWTAKQMALILRTVDQRITYAKYFLNFKRDGDWRARWTARDAAMARNFRFYANEMFPNAKIIVSGHNFHFARQNEKENVMAEMLLTEFGGDFYTVGFFGGGGSFANNSRKTETMASPTEPNDIQHFIRTFAQPSTFIDLTSERIRGGAWLFTEVTINDTFIDLGGTNTLTLSDAYDGLVLIREVTPARY